MESRAWLRGDNLRSRYTRAGRNGSRHTVDVSFLDNLDNYDYGRCRQVSGTVFSDEDDYDDDFEDEGDTNVDESGAEDRETYTAYLGRGVKKRAKHPESYYFPLLFGLQRVLRHLALRANTGHGIRYNLTIAVTIFLICSAPLVSILPVLALVFSARRLARSQDMNPFAFLAFQILVIIFAQETSYSKLTALIDYAYVAYLERHRIRLPTTRALNAELLPGLMLIKGLSDMENELLTLYAWSLLRDPGGKASFLMTLAVIATFTWNEINLGNKSKGHDALTRRPSDSFLPERHPSIGTEPPPHEIYPFARPDFQIPQRFWRESFLDIYPRLLRRARDVMYTFVEYLTAVHFTWWVLQPLGEFFGLPFIPASSGSVWELGVWEWCAERNDELLSLDGWVVRLLAEAVGFYGRGLGRVCGGGVWAVGAVVEGVGAVVRGR